ncbi:hypothetical protein COT47_03095 [Candidatus Woesearchaeota archaeon CG08_land_8_20_14_0_20_43_7]|nr:MAG: hypothetical protein COT47_03095 [Candidatus Woesearchaeota archaeon CG08_land_8_20_14_0_20_43_7]
MVHVLLYTLIAVFIVSAISLIGAATLAIRKKTLERFLQVIVAFAAGSMLAAAFFDLMPEAFHDLGEQGTNAVLLGLLFFFLIERYIHWHHCQKECCHIHPMTYLI